MSLWSLNRDTACTDGFAGVAVHSNTCSGVDQQPAAFVKAFAGLASGGAVAPVTNVVWDTARGPVVDDPATSPYR